MIKTLGKSSSKSHYDAKPQASANGSAVVHPNGQLGAETPEKTIRIATFNAALFSMAPAVPRAEKAGTSGNENVEVLKEKRFMGVNFRAKSVNERPKGILKSPLHSNSMNPTPENLSKQQKFAKSKLRVSINLPDNEISLGRNRKLTFVEEKEASSSSSIGRFLRGKAPLRSTASFPASLERDTEGEACRHGRTVVEVLRELDADILALQDVKAEEERDMKPLSDLAAALGMNYVFAESWAPEYGNAVLSKWPIKRWKVQKIFDDTDFRFFICTLSIFEMHLVLSLCSLLPYESHSS